jgi:hypothetical protein
MAVQDISPSEKRSLPRQHLIVPIHCQLFRNGESGFGWVRDFSSSGANVTSNLALTRGDELTLSLPTTGRPEMAIAAMVRWNAGPLCGVEFKPSRSRTMPQDADADRLLHLLDDVQVLLLSWNDIWRVWSAAVTPSAVASRKLSS